ncbi:MAG: hypothetical protein Q9218_002830 [Villophora microphyllina]
MGYGQWVEIKIANKTDRTLTLKNLRLHWGKLYEYPDKGKEANSNTVNDKTIKPHGSFSFASCGRENASSGTEGEVYVYDGGDEAFKIYWDCPYWGSNRFETLYVKEGWFPSNTKWSPGEQLGTITVTVFKSD